ncbi:MAG: glycoside hydrolase family 92 protein, partial [Clostridia bacterium]|nr:glycoside hydrolase family 92 protein [Clostridia bacterium]
MTNYCKYVNVFHGNGEIGLPEPKGIAAKWFFIKAGTGNTSPAATLPFGGMSVSPFSGGYPQGYGHNLPNSHSRPKRFPEGDKLLGFAHLQQSGTGAMGYYYNYAVVTPKYKNSEERRAPENEYGEPGYYSCDLEGIRCELTATNTVALHRYTFPKAGGSVEIDFDNNGLAIPGIKKAPVKKADLSLSDDNTVLADCLIEGIRLFFAVRGNGKAEISGRKAVFSDTQILKVALSFVSSEKALCDLNACPDFDTAKKAAHDAWNAVLSGIETDADERTKRIFYSNLYHSFVKPCSRPGESFVYDGNKPFVYDFATLWDMYKTALPLILMTDRKMSEDICETLFSLCGAMGRIPNSLGLCDRYAENDTQARMLGDYVLLTAYAYGYPIDPERLLDTIKTDLLAEDKRDFTVDHKCPSTTFLLDMADCCALAARLARKTGDTELAQTFESYAGLWTLAYDEKTGLLTADSPYYEGTLYNYSFRQMVDMKSRIDLAGGKERFCGLLDRFFGYGAPDTVQ